MIIKMIIIMIYKHNDNVDININNKHINSDNNHSGS